jgi:prepilin-type N-terminal cleavage/methylation domain-containing protein
MRAGSNPGVRLRGAVRQAFTLIELLVVVAIIALLISILLPKLARAKEQSRTVKCLSNLKQVGIAMQSYFLDTNDWFPWEKNNSYHYLHGFYYGGHPGRRGWWGYDDVNYRDTPGGRPFNRYIYPKMPMYDVPSGAVLYEAVRQMPVYSCPSDTGGFWNTSADQEPFSKSLYYEVGSSYDENYHFVLNWALGTSSGPWYDRWMQRANAYLRIKLRESASVFIILYEDPFDSAQWLRIPRRGWHRMWNRHSFLFLDGHANNVFTETVQGARGLGWFSASGNSSGDPKAWWNDKNDPDYRYRDIPPAGG